MAIRINTDFYWYLHQSNTAMSFYQDSPRNEQPENTGRNWFIFQIIAVLIAFCVFCMKFCSQSPCERIWREFTKANALRYLQGDRGLDTTAFHLVTDSFNIPVGELPRSRGDQAFFENFTMPALQRLLGKASQHFPINSDVLMAYQDSAYKQSQALNRDKYVDRVFTIDQDIEQFELAVDDVCSLKYKVNLFYPKDLRSILPAEIELFLRDKVRNCPEFKTLRKNPLDTRIDLAALLTCLKDHEDSLKLVMQKYDALFRMVDLGFDWIKPDGSIRFQLGDFDVSGVDKLLIDELIKEFVREIRARPQKEYEIICSGFADPNKVSSIGYSKMGRFSTSAQPIDILDWSVKETDSIRPAIRNNTQLSFARAFSGISYLAAHFPLSSDHRYQIQYKYKGEGVDRRSRSNRDKRRIEFVLKAK